MTPLLLSLLIGTAVSNDAVVVVTEAAETETLTRKEAKQLFTARKRTFANGTRVQLMVPKTDSAEMTWLSEQVLGLSPSVYQRFLAEQAYRQGSTPPPVLETPADAVSAAQALDGNTSLLTVVPSPPDDPPLQGVAVTQ